MQKNKKNKKNTYFSSINTETVGSSKIVYQLGFQRIDKTINLDYKNSFKIIPK